ncbi:MAG TPA: glycoside hydrolase family 15 protein [Streptosporangiaceae bacterium]|nr:glycoside hydrolase family 15 protein [Streptosporangiaceae bacterium]
MPGMIEDYALIGDMRSAALISRDGSVDWLCVPRFDSPACFAALLGDDRHGHWSIAPAAVAEAVDNVGDPPGPKTSPASRPGKSPSSKPPSGKPQSGKLPPSQPRLARPGEPQIIGEGIEVTRRYRGDTLILEMDWHTPTGDIRVTDFMPPRDGQPPALVRIVEGLSGSVDVSCVFRIRFGYGQVTPWVRRVDSCLLAVAGPDSLWLDTPITLTGRSFAHEATFTVLAGERVPFVLAWVPSHESAPERCDPLQAAEVTQRYWDEWVSRCTYHGTYHEAVIRSLITLKALTFQPTGGIVAAATTSLPEDLGGVRNWDYRYCWLRDATITLEALLRTGYTDEAFAWRAWLGRAVAGDPGDVQIMYGVAGERRLDEWEADWLPGYEHSAPVRIGNAAVNQRQLDVYGEVIDAMSLGRATGIAVDRHTWSLQRALLSFLEKHWDEPDEGIWEVRGPRQHFVYSKVMAWVAFDRGLTAVKNGMSGPAERWQAIRDQIHREVCEKGYDAERGAFMQYYGSSQLDAAVLLIPEVGFLPPEDPRVVSTVRAVQRELMSGGLVRRYELAAAASGQLGPDGLPGSEGAFLACSFWLANALDMIGQDDEAAELFERLLSLRNDPGLLSEEYDPRYGRQVGNTPQAFSHVPLIQAALNLDRHPGAHSRTADADPPTVQRHGER